MTQRKSEYGVIPPGKTRRLWPVWKTYWKRTRKRTIRSIPCCVWTHNRFSCSRRRGCRFCRDKKYGVRVDDEYETPWRSQHFPVCEPLWVSGKRPLAPGGRKPTRALELRRYWRGAIPMARR